MSKEFKMGDKVYYVESSANYGKQIPCTICFGKRYVTVILGDDSQCKIECGYCSHGVSPPSGFCKVWEPHARVVEGVIEGISRRDGLRYEVGYKTLKPYELYTDKELAEEASALEYEVQKERSDLWYRDNFRNATKKQVWSTGYHRKAIKDSEENIKWHKMRLCMIKEKE